MNSHAPFSWRGWAPITRRSPRCCTTSAASPTPQGDPRKANKRLAKPCRSGRPASAPTIPTPPPTAPRWPPFSTPPAAMTRRQSCWKARLAVFEHAFGPNHHEVAVTLGNLGAIDARRGNLESAEQRLRRALAIKEQTLGADNVELVPTLGTLGVICRRTGDGRARDGTTSALSGCWRAADSIATRRPRRSRPTSHDSTNHLLVEPVDVVGVREVRHSLVPAAGDCDGSVRRSAAERERHPLRAPNQRTLRCVHCHDQTSPNRRNSRSR